MYESWENNEEKRYQNIENEQCLYFVIIPLFVLVTNYLKNDVTWMVPTVLNFNLLFKIVTITFVWLY